MGGGCCAPFRGGELGPHLTQCRLGGGLKIKLKLKTNLYSPIKSEDSEVLDLCTKWYPDPSSHLVTIEMGREVGVGCCAFLGGKLRCHLRQCGLGLRLPPYLRPTSVPSGILIHPTILDTIHQCYKTDRQWSDSIGRTVLQMVSQNYN